MANTNNSLLKDTFERLAELGQHTAKETVKEVNKAFNPLAAVMEGKKNPYQPFGFEALFSGVYST